MRSSSNSETEELINVRRQRYVYGYENMSRQQLENIFTMPSASIPTPIPISRLGPRPRPAIRFPSVPIPRSRRISELLPIDMDEFDKMEMIKPDQYLKIDINKCNKY